MTPKEKSKELLDKFSEFTLYRISKKDRLKDAKQCAIIAINEILNLDVWDWPHNAGLSTIFWQKVKEEINKL